LDILEPDINILNLPQILSAEAEKTALEVEMKTFELARLAALTALQAAADAKKLEESTQVAMVAAIDANLKLNRSLVFLEESVNQALLSAEFSAAAAMTAEEGVKATEKLVQDINLVLPHNQAAMDLAAVRSAILMAVTASSDTVQKINGTVVATRKSAIDTITLKTTASKVVVDGRNAQRAAVEAGRLTAEAAQRAVIRAAEASESTAKEAATAAKLAAADIALRVAEAADLTQVAALAAGEKIAAESANKAKGSFLANMSHEIRTPLSAIIGFTEIVAEELSDDASADVRKYVDAIARNSKHLASLIDDILDISKIESGGLKIENIPTSIRNELNGVIEALQGKASKRGNSLRVTYGIGVPEFVSTDPLRLRQILINTIGNAIKFTDHGTIEIVVDISDKGVNKPGALLTFKIIDSGCGISPEHQRKLFESYGQADRSIARRFGGSGLGLILSRKLAQALGGDLVLLLSAAGKGSTFEIRIPLKGEETQPSGQDVESANQELKTKVQGEPLKGLKVLLAEDAPDLQMFFKHIVTSKGGKVQVAKNGEEAVQMALADNFDLIVMDIEMPILDGNEANKLLRARGCKAPIIAFTAHAFLDKEHFQKAIYDDYLSKPISGERLIETLLKWYKPGVPH
jgi:signal transduction histidine kinase